MNFGGQIGFFLINITGHIQLHFVGIHNPRWGGWPRESRGRDMLNTTQLQKGAQLLSVTDSII
jgi:hypothetical protein